MVVDGGANVDVGVGVVTGVGIMGVVVNVGVGVGVDAGIDVDVGVGVTTVFCPKMTYAVPLPEFACISPQDEIGDVIPVDIPCRTDGIT